MALSFKWNLYANLVHATIYVLVNFLFFLLPLGVKVSKFFLWLSIVKSVYSTGQMSYSKCGDYIWVTGIYGHCTVEGKTLSIEDITRSVLQSLSGK